MYQLRLGLLDLGYNYILLDDCWGGGRANGTNQIEPDASTFVPLTHHVVKATYVSNHCCLHSTVVPIVIFLREIPKRHESAC